MTDQLNPAAEEDYLVGLLLSATRTGLRAEALERVPAGAFASGTHAMLWTAALRLLEQGDPITRRSLLAGCHPTVIAERILDRVGIGVPPAGQFPTAVAEVLRCSRLRAVIGVADRIRQRAEGAEDAEQALAWAAEELARIDHTTETPEVRRLDSLLEEFERAMVEPDPRHWVVPTPWADLNTRIAGGLHPGRVYVIGARPGDGKSILTHQAASFAAEQGHPALVFSAEMGTLEVTGRVVASGAEVELAEIARRDLSQDSQRRVKHWAARHRQMPFFVVDKSDINVAYIRQVARAQKRRTGLAVLGVDYLQLVAPGDRGKSREQQVAEISRQLKVLARELECAVLLPAQLNRETARRGGKPTLADLRESGGIEADADVVLLLWRQVIEDDNHPLKGQPSLDLTVEIAKNRHGAVGGLELPWRAHYAKVG